MDYHATCKGWSVITRNGIHAQSFIFNLFFFPVVQSQKDIKLSNKQGKKYSFPSLFSSSVLRTDHGTKIRIYSWGSDLDMKLKLF